MQEHFVNLGPSMTAKAAQMSARAATTKKISSSKSLAMSARRLSAVAPHMPTEPISLDKAAENRVKAMKVAAGDSVRMPGDAALIGSSWYFNANRDLANAGLTERRHYEISSALSPDQQPEDERASAAAIVNAHPVGQVTVTPTIANHVKKVTGKKVDLSPHVGRSVAFSELPSESVGALTDPKIRAHLKRNSAGIDWDSISRVSNPENISKAHALMVDPSIEAQSPTKAPKTFGYAERLATSKADTDVQTEYDWRSADIAKRMRGEIHPGQLMLDPTGLRSSNEGALSNRAITAEDKWMQAISVSPEDPQHIKASAEVQVGKKTHSGVSVSKDARVGPAAVQHAWNQEATHRAAKLVEDTFQTPYTVPAMLVQETAWSGTRRVARDQSGRVQDRAYMKHLTATKAAVDATHKEALKENAERSRNLSQQMTLF